MQNTDVSLRFYEELNDFLPECRRRTSFVLPLHRPRSVKDLIESQHVPHTEVDLILVDGESVGFDCLVTGGERIAVYPTFESIDIRSVSRLGRPPLRQLRFIADVHLGTLVRRLRLLGFDCVYEPPWDDVCLAQRSADERRILLTRDRRLLMRSIVDHGIFVRSPSPDQQLHDIVLRLDLSRMTQPFSRCCACNGRLQRVDKASVRPLIPAKTWLYTDDYYQCDRCAKLYWKGTHWPRLQAIIDSVSSEISEP